MNGIDVETTALDPEEGNLRLLQISDGKRADVYDAFMQSEETLRRAVEQQDELVAHNAPFERTWLKAALDVDRADLHDTMVMSQVLYTGTNAARAKQFSHSLAAVVKRELKRELDKDEQLSDWSEPDLSREQIEYAAKDAAVLPELADKLLAKIERAGLRKVYELELRVSHAVNQMERNGFGIDLVRLDVFIAANTEQAERLKAELEEEWGINPGSSKQLREHFGLDARKDWPKTPGGSPSTNQEAMALLADEVPEIKKWLEWKRVEKLHSTYGKSLQIQKRDSSLRICQRSSSARPSVWAFCSSRSWIPHSRSSGVKERQRLGAAFEHHPESMDRPSSAGTHAMPVWCRSDAATVGQLHHMRTPFLGGLPITNHGLSLNLGDRRNSGRVLAAQMC